MLAWSLCDFSGVPDQYCLETLNCCDFSGGGGPDPLSLPPDSPITTKDQCKKYFVKTCGNIGDIMSKKYAEEKSKIS